MEGFYNRNIKGEPEHEEDIRDKQGGPHEINGWRRWDKEKR